MTSSLPPEILDLIVDHLHHEPATLMVCCLASKPWVPRTRGYLFVRVEFRLYGPSLESWMKAFPDPSNSPAHYTRSLFLSCSKEIAVAIPDAHLWVRSFNHIVELTVEADGLNDRCVSFTQLHGISPTLKSLHLFFAPPPEVLNLVCSFPLLEDLSLRFSAYGAERENADEWSAPPTSPRFTGSLLLYYSASHITRKLLDLPGSLRFSKVSVFCPSRDSDLTTQLVSKCSDTLESLLIGVEDGAFSIASAVG